MRLRPVALAALLATAVPALAQTPSDLSDLVGARGAGGETQILARGYQNVRGTNVRDQAWTFWWSDVQRQCVSIATSNGRYQSIQVVPQQNCRVAGAPAMAPTMTSPVLGAPGETISLICYGHGEKPGVATSSGYSYNSRTRRYEYGSRVESTRDGYDADLLVEITGGQGRIHLSGSLIAPINSGGRAGWWDLTDLRITPDTIRGRYRMNGLNSPRVDIDRRTGFIRIDGLEDFSGHCDRGGGPRF